MKKIMSVALLSMFLSAGFAANTALTSPQVSSEIFGKDKDKKEKKKKCCKKGEEKKCCSKDKKTSCEKGEKPSEESAE